MSNWTLVLLYCAQIGIVIGMATNIKRLVTENLKIQAELAEIKSSLAK